MKMTNKTLTFLLVLFVVLLSLWISTTYRHIDTLTLIRYILVILFGFIALISDLHKKIIPNMLVIAMFVSWFLLLILVIIFESSLTQLFLIDSALGASFGGGLFLIVYIVSKKGLGGGDVKFMAAAGLYLGLSGSLSAIFFGATIAALFSLVLILLKKITRKDALPLAPFLFIGIMITAFSGGVLS